MNEEGKSGVGRRVARTALWTGVGLVVVSILAASWLVTTDLGFVRPRIEQALTDLTGRRFEIRGGLEIDIGNRIVAVARDIRWQNAEWDESDDMLSVGYAEVQVDLWSLLRGPIKIEYVEITNADLILTRHDDGRFNWDVFSSDKESIQEDTEPGRGFLLRQVDIDAVRVVYTSPDRDRPIRLVVTELDQQHRSDDILDLDFKGTLGDRQVGFAGEAGPWSAIQSGRDIHFDLQGVFGSLEWSADGLLDDVTDLRKPTVNLVAAAPSLDDLSRMLGLGEYSEGDIDIKVVLGAQDDGPLILDVLARVGQTELEAEGTFSDLANLEQIDIDLQASGPNLGRVFGFFGIKGVREGPFKINVEAIRDDKVFEVREARMDFGETEFLLTARLPDFPTLDDATIDLNAAGPDIGHFRYMTGLPGAANGPFSIDLDLTVQPDGSEAVNLDIMTSLGHATASGVLGEAPDYVGTRFDYTFESDSLAGIGDALDIASLPDRPLAASGNIELGDGALNLDTPSSLSLGDIDAELSGRFALAKGGAGSSIRARVRGPSLASAISGFAEVDAIPDLPFDVGGRFVVEPSFVEVQAVSADVGSTNIAVDGRVALAPGLEGSSARFAVNGTAVEELFAEVGGYSVRPGAFSMSGRFELRDDELSIDDLLVERGQGGLSVDLDLGLPLSRRFADFSLSGSGADIRNAVAEVAGFEPYEAPFSVKSRGSLRGDELVLDSFNVSLGEASLSGEGRLGFGEEVSGTRFSLVGQIENMADLGTVSGREFNAQSMAWTLAARGKGKRLDIDSMTLELGGSDLDGSLSYVGGDVPRLEGRFTSDEFLIQPLLKQVETDVEPVAERDDGRLIPDLPLPLEALRAIDAKLHIDIGVFRRGDLYLENVLLDGSLESGVLELREFRLDAKSGSLVSRGSLTPAEGGARSQLEVKARDVAFGLSPTNLDLERTIDVDLKMNFVGDDLRAMLAGADGVLLFDMRGGRVGRNAFLDALYGDVLQQIMSVINPFYTADTVTILDCLVAPIDVRAGRLDSELRLIIRTDKLNMFVRPSINLGNEKMDVSVRTTPRKGISISTAELFNPYVKIVGSLGKPALAVDEQGVLISGGAAVATGGLSILAKAAWDRIAHQGNPCDATRAEAREAFAGRLPDLELERQPPAAEFEGE